MSQGSDAMELEGGMATSAAVSEGHAIFASLNSMTPNGGTTVQQRATLVRYEQWAARAMVPPQNRRTINSPDELSVIEVRECYHIVDACMMAHGDKHHADSRMFEVFLDKIFENWSSVREVLPVNPLVYPKIQQPIVARGRLEVDHMVTRDGKPLFLSTTIDTTQKSCVVYLKDAGGQRVRGEDTDGVKWRPKSIVDVEMKVTLGKAIQQIDDYFQQYNKVRAIQIARHFIACSARGLERDEQREREYKFASTLHYVCLEFPMLWAAASDQIQPPHMWS